jgi:hypothetical protein
MKSFLLTAITLFSVFTAGASAYPYDWKADRSQYTLAADEKALAEIVLKEHVEYSYVIEEDKLVMYTVYHKIVRVNNSEAIQRNNRIRVSMSNMIELIELKARTINSGKTITFDKEHLKEVKEEESGKGYKMFAMEGLEIGSEVEYLVIKKIYPQVFGRVYLQHDVPVKESSFKIKSPEHLEFDFKSYHGVSNVQSSQADGQNIYNIDIANLKPIKEEDFGNADEQTQRIEYKLLFNRKRSNAKLYTWDYAGTVFYERIFAVGKDQEKAISKFVQSLGDDPSKDQQARIRAIERKIKTTIHLNKGAQDESLEDISAILKSKVASELGITRLFAATFNALKIPVHLVMTCDRTTRKFDETFDSWNYLDEYILYFPQANTYLSPYDPELISPLVDPVYTGHKGLFIEPVEVASVKSGLISINDIPALPWNFSIDRRIIEVKFNGALTENEIYYRNDLTGHKASVIAPYYNLMSKEQQQNVIEEVTKEVVPGVAIDKWSAKTNFTGPTDEFTMEVNFKSSHLLEHAGPRILLKLGLIIGPQAEMYNKTERTLPVDNLHNRAYERTITLTIPEGYTIKNPDDLNFNVLSTGNADAPFSFVSGYKIDGQKLVVTVNEYYKELYAPLEAFEGFRKVINAAADFNKVTLVLEKVKR